MRSCRASHQRQPLRPNAPRASPPTIHAPFSFNQPLRASHCSFSESRSSTGDSSGSFELGQPGFDLPGEVLDRALALTGVLPQRFQRRDAAAYFVIAQDDGESRATFVRAAKLRLEITAAEIE